MKKSFFRKVKRLTDQTLLISRNNVAEEHNITDLSEYDQNAEKTLDSYSNETIEALPTSERSSIASEWISIPSNVLENASLPGPSQSDSLSFQEEIKLWAVKNQITHKAVEELLTILRNQPGLDGIPKSARSFLSTVREVKTRVVSPGTYCHLGIEKVLSDFFRMHKLIPPENLEIAVNIDGLPLSKSSGSQVYPILGVILNLNIAVQNVVLMEKEFTDSNLMSTSRTASTAIQKCSSCKDPTEIIKLLHIINGRVMQNSELITSLLNSRTENIKDNNPAEELLDVQIPAKSYIELMELDKKLGDKTTRDFMISKLIHVGGTDIKDIIRRCMPQLVEDEVLRQFSWVGGKGKKNFSFLDIASLIKEVCKKNPLTKNFTEKQVEERLAIFLTKATERCNRRWNKENQQNKDLPEELSI